MQVLDISELQNIQPPVSFTKLPILYGGAYDSPDAVTRTWVDGTYLSGSSDQGGSAHGSDQGQRGHNDGGGDNTGPSQPWTEDASNDTSSD